MPNSLTSKHFDIRVDELFETSSSAEDAPESFLTRLLRSEEASELKGVLCIPYWQRDYDWDQALIERFFNGLKSAFDGPDDAEAKPMRLGTIVLGRLEQTGGKPQYQRNEFLVIDGQQRLRTINNLFRLAAAELGLSDEGLSLSLVRGTGGAAEDLNDLEVLREGFTPEQSKAFSKERLEALHLEERPLRIWLHGISLHVIVTTFKFDARQSDNGVFDRVMSLLFSRINLQAKPLDDIDVVKAQLLFRLRSQGLTDEAGRLCAAWETARALLSARGEASKEDIEAVLSATLLDNPQTPAFEKAFRRGLRLSPDDIRLRFSRYLLLCRAFAEGSDALLVSRTRDELLCREGALWSAFKPLCLEGEPVELARFVSSLEKINDIFMRWRPYLLIARANIANDREPDAPGPLEAALWRLLRLQCVVAGGSISSRTWLEQPLLLALLRGIDRREAGGKNVRGNLQEVESLLKEAEDALFLKLGKEDSQHDALTARDWFLWNALFEAPEGNRCCDVMVRALERLLDGYRRFGAGMTGTKLFDDLRSRVVRPRELPTTTGAEQIEHWVSIERGRALPEGVQPRCDALENKAHIGAGTNQSLRDLSIKAKANLREASWWPTLQFLAALASAHDGWGIVQNQQGKDQVDNYLDALDRFWKQVMAELVPSAESAD